MISFRYHIVSIVAVFLALALGIVVGTTGLNGAILDDLHKQVRDLRGENSSLRSTNGGLMQQADNANAFADQYGDQLVRGSLDKQTVLVVSTPGADARVRDGVVKRVQAAGGKVTGRLQVTPDYLDPARAQEISNLVTQLQPAGLQLPVTSDASLLAAATLAYVLVGKGSDQDFGKVLAGFSQLNMVKSTGADPAPAKLAIVVTGGAPAVGATKSRALPALVGQFNQAGLKTVVAGDTLSATATGLIGVIRADSTLRGVVSTVDNADTSLGRVTTAFALQGAAADSVGQYGTGPNAAALFPKQK